MYIKINNLSKSFKLFKRSAGLKGALKSFFNREYQVFTALENINLEIEEGEIIGILGENGAGKTTLIKLMIGLLYPNKGSVLIDGFNPWERDYNFLGNIAVVMGQKNQLWWDIPASESFLLNKHIYNLAETEYDKTLNELVDYLDVEDKLNVQVRRLSLGERMKMEIIAALLHKPKIILLDEPTLGLDVISQSKIRDFVKYYNQKYKTTFVITSHYSKDIQEMCERVFVLNKGKSVYDGNFKNLVKNINPKRKLVFEFNKLPDSILINDLKEKFVFDIKDKILTSILNEEELQVLLKHLLQNFKANNISFEDIPVDDAMKSFFENPQQYI
ncbi:MAG: multidrug ABC transporter ATP-binding protein [Candidatus Marinimicrobia bacterium]|nr:multidrug ABC transporter ATP-binding protein [Candidatus Neomarinimicrobiota bacterium]|tara:strand:- start:3123 stop:4112 length:990 start_codon:yes stop_codon:yes gene_type:complete